LRILISSGVGPVWPMPVKMRLTPSFYNPAKNENIVRSERIIGGRRWID
jgi:hypothetical protein